MSKLLQLIQESIEKTLQQGCMLFKTPNGEQPETYWSEILNLINDWQTFIIGVVAFLPASFAAVFMWQQLKEQRTQFLQLTERQSHKARLRLARNVSEISRQLDCFYGNAIENSFSFEKHTINREILEDVLDAGIMSGKENFDFVKQYVTRAQRYASMCQLYSEKPQKDYLIQIFQELATMDAMTDALYPFARFEVELILTPKIDKDTLNKYLTIHLRRDRDIAGTNLSELLREKII